MIWYPSGVALGILVVEGESYWPIPFASALLFFLTEHYSAAAGLIIASTSSLQAVIGARLLKRFASTSKPKLITVRETLVFVILIMGVLALLSSSLALAGLVAIGHIPYDKFYFMLKIWWFSQAMGTLVIAAPIIYFVNDIKSRIGVFWPRRFEFLFLTLTVLAACIFIYTPLSEYNHSLVIRPYFLFPLIIWCTIRFDTLGVVTTNIIVMITMLIGAIKGVLPTGFGSVEDRMFVHELVAMTIGITGFVLAAAIREKEEALDARGEFINIASHELKTPITSLKLQYDLAARRIARGEKVSEEEMTSNFKRMGNQISRLILTIEQLLNTTRFEQGTFQLNISHVKISKILKNVLEAMSADLTAAQSEARLTMTEELAGHWDSFRVEQVLNNIISNAIKYAPGKPIEINVSGDESCARISIQDHGPGIEPTKQEMIFKRFVRAADPRKTEGLGLGLFIARRIVEAHGGEIGVKSALGDGALFEIKLPLVAAGYQLP
jgi:signal transduction histidine kinase